MDRKEISKEIPGYGLTMIKRSWRIWRSCFLEPTTQNGMTPIIVRKKDIITVTLISHGKFDITNYIYRRGLTFIYLKVCYCCARLFPIFILLVLHLK